MQDPHHINIILSNQSVISLLDTICVSGTAGLINESGLVMDLTKAWYKALQLKDVALVLSYFAQCFAEAPDKSYKIEQSFGEPTQTAPRIQWVLTQPEPLDTMKLADLCEFIVEFPSKDALK